MITAEDAAKRDVSSFEAAGGRVSYPFPIEEFALLTFGLDIQYEDFDLVFESSHYDPRELFGCLFPDGRHFNGMDRVILVNTNRTPFYLGDSEVPSRFYEDFAERQTIAHEVGHYSDLYTHNRDPQSRLFPEFVRADAPSSILVYPPKYETYANQYARHLLMPADQVIELIVRKNLPATIDLRTSIHIFAEHFGVTQFMVEIRLHELQIHFLNGIYIKKANRFRGKRYTSGDLLVLLDIAKSFDLEPNYYDADNMVRTYNMLTKQTRASGPLYMTFWRVMRGDYDERFPEVFEKRVAELTSLEAQQNSTT